MDDERNEANEVVIHEPRPTHPLAVAGLILAMIAAVLAVVLVVSDPAAVIERHEHRVTKMPVVKDRGIADEVARVRLSVVHVYKENVCQGSGCLISADGIIFSAKHVTDGQHGTYQIKLDDGRIFPVKHAIEDKENDVSFMQLDLEHARRPGPQWAPADGLDQKNYVEYIQEPNLPYARLADEDVLRPGDRVFIMGSPHGIYNFNSVSLGIVSGRGRDLYNREGGWGRYQEYNWHVMLQSTSSAFPGNSGGPVFDLDCRVIGVLVAGEAETLNFSVPVARFRDTVEDVRTQLNLCRFNVVIKPAEPPFEEYYDSYQTSHSAGAEGND
ncbi:MAG: trypsin-like serine protease [Chloroflexi bacterium]|nr:trypsin-like serine protease [Chloroflexota bacterium]